MTDTAPNHYSHSFVLNLDKLPTKKSDRIALHILYPGLIFGTILILLGFYELFNGLSHSRTDFDFIPENEGDVIYQPFMNPTFFDLVIILVGAGIVLSLFLSYIRYKKIFFDGKKVQIIYRPAFGAKKVVKESIGNYEGVRFRIEFFQFGFMTKNKYIIELYHKNPQKTAPLYISTKGKNIRKIWEYYAQKLNLPAVVLTDEGMVRREVSDLDKSIKEMVEEGKTINSYNDREPLPPTIAFVRKRDKTVIKARKIFWDAYNIIAWCFSAACCCLPVLTPKSSAVIFRGSLFWRSTLSACLSLRLQSSHCSARTKSWSSATKSLSCTNSCSSRAKTTKSKKQTLKRSKLPSTRQPAGITFRLFPTTEPLSSVKRFQLRICAGLKSF